MNKFNLTDIEFEVLTAYAKCNLNARKTAKVLYMCNTTIDSHLHKIEEKTGINPKTFFGVISLLNARCIYQDNACYVIYDGGNQRIEFKEEQ